MSGYYSSYGLLLEHIPADNEIKIGYAYTNGGGYKGAFLDESLEELGFYVNVYFYEDGLEDYYYDDPGFIWLETLQGEERYDGTNRQYVYNLEALSRVLEDMELDDNVNEDSYFEICFGDQDGHRNYSMVFSATELGLYPQA